MGGDRITIPPRTGDSGPIGHGVSPPVAAAPGAGRTIPTAWMRALLILSLLVGAIAFMGSLAFGIQHYFEYQVEEARKISQ